MKTTYACLIQMRTNALWATETNAAIGLHDVAIRYYKILCRIEDVMRRYEV